MLRCALLVAAIVLPTVAMADKIVTVDGDSFIEAPAPSSAGMGVILDALSPITPAQAMQAITPMPSAPVPEMMQPGSAQYDIRHEFDGYYANVPGEAR